MKLSWYGVENVSNWDKVGGTFWICCLQNLEHLEKLGVSNYFNEPSGDICLFFRGVSEETINIARNLKKNGKKVVYILDVNYLERIGDSLWLNQVNDEHIKNSHIFCQLSDIVLCTSPYIAERVQHHGYLSVYWPQGIDNRHFIVKKEINLSEPLLVWCGHAIKAELVDEVTLALNSKLLIISEMKPKLSCSYKFKKWKYRKLPSYLLQADIGIAPRVLDNSYNLGHSSFKILVYLAAGLPVLVAPLPSYCDIIVNGENGFICKDIDDYKKYFKLLTTEMGKAAKETALRYDASVMAQTLIKILKEKL